jgi:orotate phosphoribosyltransferase
VQQPRAVNPDHFTCGVSLTEDSHVLVIDDTWATGGHVQSAILAVRKAGAGRVSALIIARWLKEDFKDNKQFITDLRNRDYDPSICPWTSASCPS